MTDNNRGIESPDLEKVDDRCPEKVMSIFDEDEYCFLLGESIKTAMASVLGKSGDAYLSDRLILYYIILILYLIYQNIL